jgi:hypothetical protein
MCSDGRDLKVGSGGPSDRGVKVIRIIGLVLVGVLFAALFALLLGGLVMILWNRLLPAIFGISAISYWQAFGITLLAKILFSGFHGPHHKPDHFHGKIDRRWHRWIRVDDADGGAGLPRKDWHHYHDFWMKEGEAAFSKYLEKTGSGGSSVNEKPE